MDRFAQRHAPRKTRGSQLLRDLIRSGLKQDKIAKSISKRIGRPISQSSVSKWSLHRHMPQGEAMVAMQTLYGIPVEAWTQPPEVDDEDGDEGPAAELPTGTGD